MKKWQWRTVIVLALGAVGFVALGYRPALSPDEAQSIAATPLVVALKDEGEQTADWGFTYTWDLAQSPGYTIREGDAEPSAFSLLKEPRWEISVEARNGKLIINAPAPLLHTQDPTSQVTTKTRVRPLGTYRLRTADGSMHVKRMLMLVCQAQVMPSWWGEITSTSLLQVIMLDMTDGTADLINPQNMGLGTKGELLLSMAPSGLPARYNGSACRRELLLLHDALCSVSSPLEARQVAEHLNIQGQRVVTQYAAPELEWPHNWGNDAETAEEIHKSIIPTLQFLQEQDCFGSQELADFINGPVFGAIFGESFVSPEDKQQAQAPEMTIISTGLPDEALPGEAVAVPDDSESTAEPGNQEENGVAAPQLPDSAPAP